MKNGKFTILCAHYNYTDEAIDNGNMSSMFTIGAYDTLEQAKASLIRIIKCDRFVDHGSFRGGFQANGSWLNVYNDDLETYYTIIERHEFTTKDWPKNPWPKVDEE